MRTRFGCDLILERPTRAHREAEESLTGMPAPVGHLEN